MIDAALLQLPEGAHDVTVVREIDGLSYIDPDDPAMPSYRVIANNRQPVALRDMMILPVRTGYIGADRLKPDPALIPPTGEQAGLARTSTPIAIYLREHETLSVLPGLGEPKYNDIEVIDFHTSVMGKYYGKKYREENGED